MNINDRYEPRDYVTDLQNAVGKRRIEEYNRRREKRNNDPRIAIPTAWCEFGVSTNWGNERIVATKGVSR